MTDIPKRLVSIVAPAYNEEANLRELFTRVSAMLTEEPVDFEIVIVENGSTDRSLDLLKQLHEEDPPLNYVSLSRNFGHQGGLLAGLHHARGDVVVTMDADLQHPPECLPEMLSLWRSGHEIVFTLKRQNGSQPILRKIANAFFYRFVTRLSGLELSGGQSDFRLMDRKAVDSLLAMPECGKFLRGLTRWVGFRQTTIEYDVPPRFAGESKFRFTHLVRFALDGVLSFSIMPLRLFTLFGLVVSGVAFTYGMLTFVRGLYAYLTGYGGKIPPGWATIGVAIFFFGGVQLIGIGLLGEYLGRVYDEVKHRPAFLVRESSTGDPKHDDR